jgi:hypothetical protein
MPDYLQLTDPVDGEEVLVDIFYIAALAVDREAPNHFTLVITLVNSTEYSSLPYESEYDALNMFYTIADQIRLQHARPIVQDGAPFVLAPSSHEQ